MRRIQAYFKNESNAESAKTSLTGTEAVVLDMGPLEAPIDRDSVIVAVPYAGSSTGTGLPADGSGTPAAPAGIAYNGIADDGDEGEYSYSVTIETPESELNKVLGILADNHGKASPLESRS